MSPSVKTRVQTSAMTMSPDLHPEASTSTTSIDAQLSSTITSLSISSPFTTTTKDLPDQLDDCVKETLLLGFAAAVMHSALRDVASIREAVLGSDRIKQLVAQGCSPDMIGTMIANKKSLMDGFKSVEGHVRDLALGFCLVQVASQFDTVSLSKEPSIDAVRLRRFQSMINNMKADKPKRFIEFSKIDYTPLHKYIEAERYNGNLVGDPAWEDTKKTSKKYRSWQENLSRSIQALDNAFRKAADEVDWSASSRMDAELLQAMPASALISLTLTNYESAALRLSVGPLAPNDSNNKTAGADAESLSQLGRDFRSDLLDHTKHLANHNFTLGDYAMAEMLYNRAVTAGSNDASVPINRAAALLKLNRFDEAQKCCTIGLVQLDLAEKTMREGTRSKSKQTASASQRSRPMSATKETLNELRWKAFVRRGRAYKGSLTDLGGISSDEFAYLEGQQEEEEHRSEKRGQLLLAARSDFASALQIDPLDDIPRQEMASLTIDPLQRRPSSGQQQHNNFALASIVQVDREQRRLSQDVTIKPSTPRRSISS